MIKEYCEACEKDVTTGLSDAPEHGITFYAPVCTTCRARAIRELSRTAFDDDYDRAIARGWAD